MRKPVAANAFHGKWRIVAMEQWECDYIDLVEPGYIAFRKGGHGEFVFGAVQAGMDCRYDDARDPGRVEFSWEGQSEGDPVCGRGWAVLGDGNLDGRLYFHLGDESGFKASRT